MMQQHQARTNQTSQPIERTASRFDNYVIVAFDCLSLYDFHHAIDYHEQPHRDTLSWIIKSGRFEILQGKKGDVITLKQGENYPPLREQKRTTFQHTLKRRVSEVLFWVSLYKNAGSTFTPESLFMNLFPWLDYETA